MSSFPILPSGATKSYHSKPNFFQTTGHPGVRYLNQPSHGNSMPGKQQRLLIYCREYAYLSTGEKVSSYSFRKKVLQRDKKTCQHCFNVIFDHFSKIPRRIEAHHIIPRKEGGKNTLENGISLCNFCHLYIGYRYWRHGLYYTDIQKLKSAQHRIEDVRNLIKKRYVHALIQRAAWK